MYSLGIAKCQKEIEQLRGVVERCSCLYQQSDWLGSELRNLASSIASVVYLSGQSEIDAALSKPSSALDSSIDSAIAACRARIADLEVEKGYLERQESLHLATNQRQGGY